MSLEALSALAQIGTFVVITVTAIAALIQLKHVRTTNLISTLQEISDYYEKYRDAFSFVRLHLKERLEDPTFRAEIRAGALDRGKHSEFTVCNVFDQSGAYYRQGAIDRETYMRLNALMVLEFWALLEPVIALLSARDGANLHFEHFEYLAMKAQDWIAAHPAGDYPKGARRLPLAYPWKDDE